MTVSHKRESNSNEIEKTITLADFLAIIDTLSASANQSFYINKWAIFEKEKATTSILTNIFGKRTGLKVNIILLIENVGDRLTVYDIKAFFINERKKQRMAADSLMIHSNSLNSDDFVVIEKGEVALMNIAAILNNQQIEIPLDSFENLELFFMATGGYKTIVIPL